MFCRFCGEPWDRARAMNSGRYVQQNPGVPVRGVALTRLMDPFTKIRSLWLGSEKRKGFRDSIGDASAMQKFINNDLG